MICITDDGKPKRGKCYLQKGHILALSIYQALPSVLWWLHLIFSLTGLWSRYVIIPFHKFVPVGKLRQREVCDLPNPSMSCRVPEPVLSILLYLRVLKDPQDPIDHSPSSDVCSLYNILFWWSPGLCLPTSRNRELTATQCSPFHCSDNTNVGGFLISQLN